MPASSPPSRPIAWTPRLKGRRVDPQVRDAVIALLGPPPYRRDLLIEDLHRLQDALGQLPIAHLVALADLHRLAPVEVYEVATFYHHFDVVEDDAPAPPPLTVRVCESLSCALAGSEALLSQLRAAANGNVRIVPAPCMGRCEHAPVAVVGQHPIHRAGPASIAEAIASRSIDAEVPAATAYAAYRAAGGYALYADCAAGRRTPEAMMTLLDEAGLRGLGGAGFPAGRKWRIVAAEPAPRLMAVNADEGEPGTFKDRQLLEQDPHRALEGMLVAAWAVGAEAVYVYLRDEYHGIRRLLERELDALRADPPLAGVALPRIELRRGAGAYICGEESSMIESIEGKRGLPRLRPPYVAQRGLFGRPTLVHNIETLAWIRPIAEHGAAWFAGQGRRGRKGLRAFSVSGRVARPGVHLAPAGITVRELIDEHAGGMAAGHRFYAYLPGGASGGILPASLGDLPLDFDTLAPHGCFIGSAAVIVLSDRDRAADAARNVMAFFRDESCGQCTPCRAGTAKAHTLMQAAKWDRPLLDDLCATMADASICGLGQAAGNPVRSVLAHFAHELA